MPDTPQEDTWPSKEKKCNTSENGDIRYQIKYDEYIECQNGEYNHVDIFVDTLGVPESPLPTEMFFEQEKCTEGDKWFKFIDSTYAQCSNGKWHFLNEKWTIIPITERFLPIQQGQLIPYANFNTPFTLQPPQPLNNGTVRCTFDGSEPDSTTPTFIENMLIDTTTVIRCSEFNNGKPTKKQSETYFINETIRMPVISISVSPDYVSKYLDIPPCKTNPCMNSKIWEDVEYPAHIEYFLEGSKTSKKAFEIDAGISLMGGWSRNQQKKSISIVIRKKYQNGKLHYPLFDTRPQNNKFKAFILRNNGNRFNCDYIEDAMATSLLEGTNVDYQRSRQVIVFYNGKYHGIYDMREKLNEHFIETNYGIDAKSVDIIKHSLSIIDVKNGTSTDYLKMLNYAFNNDFSKSNTPYDSISKMIDMANFMEYMAAEIYYRNDDWPHNNVRAWKSKNTRWKFIAFDIDHGFNWKKSSSGFNIFEWIQNGGPKTMECATNNNYKCFHNIFVKLNTNSIFRQMFINRASYLYSMFINYDIISNRIDEINNTIDAQQIMRDKKLYKRPNDPNICKTGFDTYGENIKSWSKERDWYVRDEFRNKYNLGEDLSISIIIKGNGRLKLDNMYIIEKNKYDWKVFKNHPIQLTIECFAGSTFKSWENKSTSPNRLITPQENTTYTAECI